MADLPADRLAAAVPSVIARAVLDWHFRGPLAELQQLEDWWEGARVALEGRQELWDRLVQEEGIFLRRIDRGVEALKAARALYLTHVNFGTSLDTCHGWPEALPLLAEAAAEMSSRLRPVRDSAAWRVVDAAKAIEKELSQEKVAETWSISEREALQVIVKALGGQAEGDSVEQLLAERSEKLMKLLSDLRETFGKDDLARVLDDLLRAVVSLREDLSVSDSPEGLDDCVREWQALGEACGAAGRLEAAVAAANVRKDASLRQPLALLRGLHVLLQRSELRSHLIGDGYESSETQAQGEVREVCHPPSPSPTAHSPRDSGYAPRKQRAAKAEAGYAADAPAAPGMEAQEAAQAVAPAVPALPREILESSRGSFKSRPSTRPGTPSWLRPPWQRSDSLAASWTRPDTPSTVCDDAEAANLPRWKVVDGHYVPLKSSGSGRFLPPLQVEKERRPQLS